jgi:acetyltransferase-like isoleucine patch superfamily enzyme
MNYFIYKIFYTIRKKSSIVFSTIIFRFKLRYFKCSIGIGSLIDGKVLLKFSKTSALTIGKNFNLNSRPSSNLVGISNLASFQCIFDGKIIIGDNCGFTSSVLSARNKIVIGDYVKIGGNVRIFDHDYHSLDHIMRKDPITDAANTKIEAVIVGNNVFIGTNSIILKGVNIGDRSIIGAGSVVSLKNIPEDSIVAGNPARIIKTLERTKD